MLNRRLELQLAPVSLTSGSPNDELTGQQVCSGVSGSDPDLDPKA